MSTATATAPTDLDAIEAELKSLSNDELRVTFFQCYTGAAEFIGRAAMAVKEMKARDMDTAGMPMVGYFLRIANGQVDPELAWKFSLSRNRQLVERLPMHDQKRLAADPMVPVAEPKPGGGYTKRMIDLTTAPPDVARVIVGDDGIRSVEDQIGYRGAMKSRPLPPAEDEEVGGVPDRSFTIRLTTAELETLRVHATRARISDREMARRFLFRAGAFKQPKS